MADDKKNIPEAAPPAEAPAPAVENAVVPEQPAPEPALTDAEAVMLEHEGQAALFEMGEAVPDPADAVTSAEVEEPAAPEVPKAEMEQAQPPNLGKDDPAPAHSGKVVDFAAARDEAAKEEKKAVKQRPPTEKDKAAKPGRGRPPKDGKAAPDKAKPPKPRDKKSQSKPTPEKPAVDKGGAPAGVEVTPEPSAPRDATRPAKEEIVYLNLSDLHPFKNHPFGVRDDVEMQGLVESVKAAGVNQPALVRPREDGGYEIIAGHRRQRASELAGFANMPCIVRNMTDDEAILAMTDDNLRHRERILPTEKAQSLKMQVEAIKHQGSRSGEEDKDAGKRSTQLVGDRNGMNYKQVQRYIRLTELVPDLQKMVDEKKLAFTPAVEISFIRLKNQRYIAVSIEGQQSSPSLSQAQKMRELDKDGKLNGDVIDGILSQEKKEVDNSDSKNDLSTSFIEAVKQNPAFDEGGELYTTKILEEAFSVENGVTSNYNKDAEGNPLVQLYGADDFLLNSMDVIEGTIDWEALKSGNYVLYALTADDNGNIIDDPNIHVGDTLHFNHVQMNGLSSSIDNNFDCKVMAKVLINENTDTIRSTGFAKFYMPTDVFLPLCEQPHLVSFPFNVVDGMEADMEEFLSSYVEDIEPSMNYDSKQTYINSFNDLTSLIITIGGALSIIIGLIGITNFVNSVLTSIITRRKELAMLQSIGMTGKQLKKMLSFEGLYYAAGTVVASIVFGSLVSVIIVRAISNSIWFFTYKFVIFPMFVIYPFLIALTVIIPAIIYRKIAKTSIIERLHQN